MTMTKEQILTIWRNIHSGVGNHGSFLRCFAGVMIRADQGNFEVLRSASSHFIEAYELDKPQYFES